MRILLVNWNDRENPHAGGAETHLHEIFGRLAGQGHAIDLVTSGWSGAAQEGELDGMRVRRVGGRHTFALAARPAVRRLLAASRYDVVVEDINKLPLFLAGLPDFDQRMGEAAEHWRLERVGVVERNVLRLALAELAEGSTPARVVIDEAVKLAHWFAGAKAPGFVNGVLDAVAREFGAL